VKDLNQTGLHIAADVIDAIDPALPERERMDAATRARRANPDAALAITLGILAGFVNEIHKMDPTVVAQLRANAAKIDWAEVLED
jgi:hypothetical protein